MRTITTAITTTFIFCSAPSCTVDPTPESETALHEEALEHEESITAEERCYNAVDDGVNIWTLMCGAALDIYLTRPQAGHCHSESSEGRAAGYKKCRSSCPTACFALSTRWELYCEEHSPFLMKSICEQARQNGQSKCLSSC